MSESAQVVKTIYDNSPAEVQVLVDTLFMKWGAEDFRTELLQKAKRVRPREQKRASSITSELGEIWKACREDGTAPDIENVQKLWGNLQTLKKEITKGQNDKNCGSKDRRVYSQAVELYREDERELLEAIRGAAIAPTKKLDPAILARIEVRRKENAAKSK